jgi:hypothetical protein
MARQTKGKNASFLQAKASIKKRKMFATRTTGTKNGSNPTYGNTSGEMKTLPNTSRLKITSSPVINFI